MKKCLIILCIVLISSTIYAQKQRNVLFGTAIISTATGLIVGNLLENSANNNLNRENSASKLLYDSNISQGTMDANNALTKYNNELHDNKVKYDKLIKAGIYTRIAGASVGGVLAIIALTINDSGKLALYNNGKESLLVTQRGTQIGLSFNF